MTETVVGELVCKLKPCMLDMINIEHAVATVLIKMCAKQVVLSEMIDMIQMDMVSTAWVCYMASATRSPQRRCRCPAW